MIFGDEPLLNLLALVVTIILGLQGPPALADAIASQALTLPQLMLRLSSVKAATARFVERKYLHMLNAPLEGSGTLIYVAPNSLQKITQQPKLERLLIDRDALTIEHEGKAQTVRLADYPQVWGLIEGIRATLAGDLTALDRFYEPLLDGNLDAWQLVLKPRDERMREIVQSIRIFGNETHIKRIETQERDGDRSEMAIVEDTR